MIADLHCHSTASDGELTPPELYAMARESGVELLALTDHDTVDGVSALMETEHPGPPCRLVSGVEISTVWYKRSVHVVGLNFDLDSPLMREALAGQREVRFDRARRIGRKLAQRGIDGAYEGALRLAENAAPCRPHFARWLVEQGLCEDGKQAFSRYLDSGKLSGINNNWPGLEQAVSWIVGAGGVAVLAHPEDYRLTRSKLRALLRDFVAAGGGAMELAGAGKADATAQTIEALCREFELHASVGSDYHGASQRWRRLGKTRPMPAELAPVWELFQ